MICVARSAPYIPASFLASRFPKQLEVMLIDFPDLVSSPDSMPSDLASQEAELMQLYAKYL